MLRAVEVNALFAGEFLIIGFLVFVQSRFLQVGFPLVNHVAGTLPTLLSLGVFIGCLLVLNQDSPLPPYEQIGQQIRALIASAQLLPGTLLPSVRQLANDLGVAPNIVVRAYKELEGDRWIVTSRRKRTIVASKPPGVNEEERRRRLEQVVAELLLFTHQLDVSSEQLHSEIDKQLAIRKAMELGTIKETMPFVSNRSKR